MVKSVLVTNPLKRKHAFRHGRLASVALGLFALTACRGLPNLTGESPALGPVEEWKARSECHALSTRLFADKSVVAKAKLSGSGEGKLENGFTAHYNSKRNRRYVDMVTSGVYPLNSVRRIFDAQEGTEIVQCIYRSSVTQPEFCWNAEDKPVAPLIALKAIDVLMERQAFDATERELGLSTPQPAPVPSSGGDALGTRQNQSRGRPARGRDSGASVSATLSRENRPRAFRQGCG
jgi:hypothetical protein